MCVGVGVCVVNMYSLLPVPGEEEKEESPPRRGSASMGVRKVRCGPVVTALVVGKLLHIRTSQSLERAHKDSNCMYIVMIAIVH